MCWVRDASLPLGSAAALWVASLASAPMPSPVETEARPLRVLFLGHEQERHHPSATLLPLLAAPLARRGIQLTHVMTPEEALTSEKLAHYDALMIYANHKTLTPEQERALLEFVEGGKGVVAIHCASAMFTDSERYIALIGGEFQRHGTGEFTAEIVAPGHPAITGCETVQDVG